MGEQLVAGLPFMQFTNDWTNAFFDWLNKD